MKKKISVVIIILLLVTTVVLPALGDKDPDEIKIVEECLIDEQKEVIAVSDDIDWWPMFHHDLNNTGNSSSPDAPNPPIIKWTFATG